MSSNVTNFWRSYVYIGVLTYSMGALAVVVYSLTTPGPHRQAMVILGVHEPRSRPSGRSDGPGCAWCRRGGPRPSSPRGPRAPSSSSPSVRCSTAASAARSRTSSCSPCSSPAWRTRRGRSRSWPRSGSLTTLVVGLLTPHRSWSTTAFLVVAMVIAGVITAAAALTRDRLMGQLMEAASVDALTGCLSRGAFEERLEHEAKRARRHHTSFSLIVADVDNLKTLNDSSGHHSGDRALTAAGGRPVRGGPGDRCGGSIGRRRVRHVAARHR